jgi:hypothetical protein
MTVTRQICWASSQAGWACRHAVSSRVVSVARPDRTARNAARAGFQAVSFDCYGTLIDGPDVVAERRT